MEELVGLTVSSLYKNEENTILMFDTNLGQRAFELVGDSDNRVWFEHLKNVEALEDAKITSVKFQNWDDVKEECTDCQVVESFTLNLLTSKGNASIEIRNSHIGFYGGYIQPLPSCEEIDFEEVKKDF